MLQYDCGWSPNVTYTGDTIIIYAPYSWIPGHQYYVTFDSGTEFQIDSISDKKYYFNILGAASGTEFCRKFLLSEFSRDSNFSKIGAESAPITDPRFWVFDIWDPSLSSTTTTTTTPPTTHTVTTRVKLLTK